MGPRRIGLQPGFTICPQDRMPKCLLSPHAHMSAWLHGVEWACGYVMERALAQRWRAGVILRALSTSSDRESRSSNVSALANRAARQIVAGFVFLNRRAVMWSCGDVHTFVLAHTFWPGRGPEPHGSAAFDAVEHCGTRLSAKIGVSESLIILSISSIVPSRRGTMSATIPISDTALPYVGTAMIPNPRTTWSLRPNQAGRLAR